MKWFEYILIHYRWIIVILFLLPASFLYDLWYYARSWIVFQLNSAPGSHDQKVQNVQRQVREWIANGRKERMCTARPGWQTISFREGAYKKTLRKVSINMIDIIKIDTVNKVVVCEPLVTMGQLTQTLTGLGWTIPVVPEMDDLTIGGLVMGTGIETSSHRVGLFQHICRAFELVLADASVIKCSEKENPDLFFSVPWSYGTLGFLTAVHIDIIPAQRFVRIEYLPCHSLDDMVNTFAEETQRKDTCDFVEGIMFSLDKGVVMRANMCTSAEPGKVNPIGKWYKPWFFRHVESFLDLCPASDSLPTIEYLPLRDYYHRHTRSIFWELQDIIPFGNHPLFRYTLGWLVPPKVSLLKLTQGQTVKKLYEENHFIQDMLIPLSSLKEALHVFEEQVKIYPLWLCPFLLPSHPGMLRAPSDKETMFVDIGSYGVPKVDNFHPIETTRRVEEFVRNVKGFQMMYADSYMTGEEYRQMFDHTLYDRLRSELECNHAFPEVFDKVNRKARI